MYREIRAEKRKRQPYAPFDWNSDSESDEDGHGDDEWPWVQDKLDRLQMDVINRNQKYLKMTV